MFQVTFIVFGRLHVVSTPNMEAAFATAGQIKGSRLWHYPQKGQPSLIC
jgi:hypothetical protein